MSDQGGDGILEQVGIGFALFALIVRDLTLVIAALAVVTITASLVVAGSVPGLAENLPALVTLAVLAGAAFWVERQAERRGGRWTSDPVVDRAKRAIRFCLALLVAFVGNALAVIGAGMVVLSVVVLAVAAVRGDTPGFGDAAAPLLLFAVSAVVGWLLLRVCGQGVLRPRLERFTASGS
ncbi:MAG: hypothetical protein QM597_02580 [Aeromicrobium sp.]|uniref:hypothetical protein n=1 Tax=Aeromicrobium sp. TaxID=1871063 RepID=UPI0039E27301